MSGGLQDLERAKIPREVIEVLRNFIEKGGSWARLRFTYSVVMLVVIG